MSSLIVRRRLRARRQPTSNRAIRWLLIGVLAIVALGAAATAAGLATVFAVYQHYAKDYVPIEEKLRQANVGLTEIYDRGGPDGGVYLGALPNPDAQLLNPVKLEQMSKWIVLATVSTEDNSFYDNPGVNVRGLVRAAYENYVKNDAAGTGGSSITQQLIKNVYICPNVRGKDDQQVCITAERTLDRKLREIAYALELTEDYTKDQILGWYLNQISYAGQYVGVQAAAQGYFRKDAADLTLGESALLAGIPAYPTRYHPRLNCEKDAANQCIVDGLGRTTVTGDAKARQVEVLDLMVRHGRITAAEAEAAAAEPLLVYAATNPLKASAFIDNQVEPRLVRMCKAGLLPQTKGTADCGESVHTAGYRVTTTLDWELTRKATALIQELLAVGIDNGCQCYNAAVVTIDPSSGQVMVYAPNSDPSNTTDPRVKGTVDQLTEINQPGSSFKPAVYLTWFDVLDKAPMSTFWDTSPLPVAGVEIVNPRTSGPNGQTEGLISARAGLGGSQNVPAFRAAYEAGVDNVIATAKKLGITTLQQGFDPTWENHEALGYGASIATGGANIRAIDMAYMDATIANMGKMVGTPHLADTLNMKDLANGGTTEGDYQSEQFRLGHLRLPGTRELDPIVVLEVRDINGNVIFRQGGPETRQVVDAGSVWLLHSIMSDCTARFVIWGCGGGNGDLALDFYMSDGQKVPSGVKTGTQQGPKSAADTLETWMTGYSRYAATAAWVGNANNDLVMDGPSVGFASGHTATTLWKTWMGIYHDNLQANQIFATPAGFDELRPKNVAMSGLRSPSTDRVLNADLTKLCDQVVSSWVRTDVTYEDPCEEKEIDTRNGLLASNATPAQFREKRRFVKLPTLKPEIAEELAKKVGIPLAPKESSTGQAAVSITTPTNSKTLSGDTPVIGTIGVKTVKEWRLEYGEGSNPSKWDTITKSDRLPPTDVLGVFETRDLKDGVYTIRLVVDTPSGALSTSVTFNLKKDAATPTRTPPGSVTPGTRTPTPTSTP